MNQPEPDPDEMEHGEHLRAQYDLAHDDHPETPEHERLAPTRSPAERSR